VIGTGIIIHKAMDNDNPSIIILTVFHIVVAKLEFTLLTLIGFAVLLSVVPGVVMLYRYSSMGFAYMFKIILCLVLYVTVGSCLIYYLVLMMYPFLFNSIFEISLSDKKINREAETSQIKCQVVSSRLALSYTWWDDIGLIKCSNLQSNIFQYIEECKPILDNNRPPSSDSINVIGYVGHALASFDLVIDPFFSSLLPLISMDTFDGKTPANLLTEGKFMNCTGKLRAIDGPKMFIDTPSTYGFSGGACFFTAHHDGWSFDGILNGATRLWNVCTSLKHSHVFLAYYRTLNKTETRHNFKTDL
jgi:hypothetical protein